MYEAGVDLVVTPYRGRPVESPWWRVAANPAYLEGESYQAMRSALARVKGDRYLRRDESHPEESGLDRVARETIRRWVTPRWKRHLERLVEREKPDAIVVSRFRWRISGASRMRFANATASRSRSTTATCR
jgi:hypothetical protein